MSFGSYNKMFEEGNFISSIKEECDIYEKAWDCNFVLSYNFYRHFFKGLKTLYKKKNYNAKLKSNGMSAEKENKKSNKNIADILDIQIKDKMIKVGNRYSSVLKLGNIDYHMLSNDEQEAIENVLIQTALSIDYSIQFYNTTENIDTTKIISEMKDNELDSYKANEYKEYMIKYLENLMENRNITVVRNYAIISYDGTIENASFELMRLCNSFKSNLLRAKIQVEILEEFTKPSSAIQLAQPDVEYVENVLENRRKEFKKILW